MKPEPLRWWEIIAMAIVAQAAIVLAIEAALLLNVMPWGHK